MKRVRTRIAVGATIVGLGGLAGIALSAGHGTPAKTAALKPLIRTEVIRRTTRVTKHAKPTGSVDASPVSASAEPAAYYSPPPPASEPVTTSSSGAATAPVTTSTSGAGAGEEHEHESDDGGGEIEGADD